MRTKIFTGRRALLFSSLLFSSLLFSSLLLVTNSCTKEIEPSYEESCEKSKGVTGTLEISYEVESTTLYQYDESINYSNLDIATMTPLRDKQKVYMQIGLRGDVYMEPRTRGSTTSKFLLTKGK